ncbi:MAG: HlyD family efflux transporter periplasmic adaptor subunit [Pseudomonadales bacterium]|nr:HlyD family efflux transporter periplasmic adaptor subunit [Pseudomonadales bacterium]
MDIVRTPERKPFHQRYWYLSIVLIVMTAVAFAANRYRNVTYLVSRDTLLIDEVAEGDLLVSVRGFGQLVARDVYWIGAESEGTVARILVRPGDLVRSGEVLVELVNPQLLQQLTDSELEFAARQAEARASAVQRESQFLDLKTEAANAEIDHLTAKMDFDAKSELVEQGLNIISRVDYERSQLAVQKYLQRWEMQKQRVAKHEESMRATEEAERVRLSQTQNELQKIRDQVANLKIRSGQEGIVQGMQLELGQQIRRGDNITRIARPDQLVAEVQIQELQVNDIQTGMKATVDTRTSKMDGFVSRIDPAVVDGSVLVEVELTGQLPREVRPELNIEADIRVAYIENTLSVRRPVFAQAYSEGIGYRLTAEGDIAERVVLRYGQASTNYIEILSGLQTGDRIIVSDPSSFDTHERILIR